MAEALVDIKSGAPLAIREVLASTPKDQRKSVLSEYYGQAFTAQEMLEANPDMDIDQFGGADQLFFIDNGQFKVVDPPGFIQSVFPPRVDVGDIVEGGRVLAETGGGVIGGAIPLAAGQMGPQALTPEEIYTVPAGAALGAEFGGQLYDRTIDLLSGGAVPRGTPAQEIGMAATNIGLEMAGGRAADAAVRAG